MYRIGLTGGIASGKSTVSALLSQEGIPIIDADQLSRRVVEPGSRTMDKIRDVFGSEIFRTDGTLDREKMAKLIFTEEDKRHALNEIIHPAIWRETEKGLWRLQEEGYPIAVIDAPLLIESGWQLRVESIWVVCSTLEQQIERMYIRNGYSPQEAMSRISRQMPTPYQMNYADVVIDNSLSLENTAEQVHRALTSVRKNLGETAL